MISVQKDYALRLGLVLAMCGCGLLSAETVNIVLVAGQSNASGRADIAELPASPFDSEIEFYYDTDVRGASTRTDSSGQFVVLAPPGVTFGPEMTLGRTLHHQGVENLAVVKVTRGGTNLRTDWERDNDGGDQMYALFIDTTEAAFDLIEQRGDTVNVLGMVWHQGEGDAGYEANNPGAYQSNLTSFIANVRSDLNRPALPFIIGGVLEEGREELYAAQRATAAAVGGVEFVSSTQTVAFDVTTHFDGKSQQWMGTRFARALTPATEYLEFEQPRMDIGSIDDQDGWRAGGGSESLVVSTYPSGAYVAGQAIGHVDSGGAEHIGTTAVKPIFGNSISADFFAGDATDHDQDGASDYDDDLTSDSTVRLFGWVADHNEDGLFSGGANDQSSVGVGLDNDGSIGLKTADGTEITTGTSYEVDKWYRLTLTWSEPDGAGDRQVHLFANNLTDEIELNGGAPLFTATITASQFGSDPSGWIGTGIRATRGLIDNIHYSTRDDILDGDYNDDGNVDSADYSLWRDAFDHAGSLPNDLSKGIGRDDYTRWALNYGATLPLGVRGAPVPEPSSLLLLLLAAVAACVR